MYWLMSIDVLLRIVTAMAFMFVVVPALALPRRRGTTFVERCFWNLGVGLALLTLAGQILTLGNLFSLPTLLLLALVIVIAGRARQHGVGPVSQVKAAANGAFLVVLNIVDGRVNVRRRVRRLQRRLLSGVKNGEHSDEGRRGLIAWSILIVVAAAFRLYRPFASANPGFSDTYVHLYLLKLLEDGRQVDPEWGPYPRGLQFLLLAIQQLTNADPILLMNFFGAVVGVIMTISVAATARRLSGSMSAALIAGLLFATLAGGPGQYFILGGAFSADDAETLRTLQAMSYPELVATRGSFDLALTVFQRQTSTLPQELAIVLLFPSVLFLLSFLRTGDRWQLTGYAGGAAAIAATHSGVLVPLALMSALALIVTWFARGVDVRQLRTTLIAATAATLVGSAWALAFIAYPYAGGKSHGSMNTSVATAVFYYFPFLRRFAPAAPAATDHPSLFVSFTPFLLATAAIVLLWALLSMRRPNGAGRTWIAATYLTFLLIHFSSRLGLPQIVEIARNSQWLLMALAAALGIVIADVASKLSDATPIGRRTAAAVIAVPLLLLWIARVPRLTDPLVRDQIVDYSGYSGTTLAVLEITRRYEPYTWTLITYGQEFPMVLRRGFHIPAVTFLERYDPSVRVIPIPTPLLFVIVEKTPHRFEINTWAQSFSRSDLQRRLQTWIHVYQATHRNLRVVFEDDNVRVYRIDRPVEEMNLIMRTGATS